MNKLSLRKEGETDEAFIKRRTDISWVLDDIAEHKRLGKEIYTVYLHPEQVEKLTEHELSPTQAAHVIDSPHTENEGWYDIKIK